MILKKLSKITKKRFSCRSFSNKVYDFDFFHFFIFMMDRKSDIRKNNNRCSKVLLPKHLCNSQPWKVHLVSGEKLIELKSQLTKLAQQDKFDGSDIPYPESYEVD